MCIKLKCMENRNHFEKSKARVIWRRKATGPGQDSRVAELGRTSGYHYPGTTVPMFIRSWALFLETGSKGKIQMYLELHNRLFSWLDGISRPLLVAASVLCMVVIAALDYLAGAYSLAILYVIPIFLCSWFAGKWPGFCIALACGASRLVSNLAVAMNSATGALYIGVAIDVCYMLLLSLMFSTLKRKLDNERNMARTDPLTKAWSRRGFYELAEYEISRSRRYSRPLTFAYLDLDNFKLVNDQLGHQAGDKLLCDVADFIRRNSRKSDLLARVGGDEFAIMLPETDMSSARIALDKLRTGLLEEMGQAALPVSFSMGIVSCDPFFEDVDEILKEADTLMYSVKSHGKNGIACYHAAAVAAGGKVPAVSCLC